MIDLTKDDSANIVGAILSGDLDFVDLIYNLSGPDNNALEPFGPDRELILAIGAEETLSTVSLGSVVRFNNPEHLSLLEVADYLTISLYLNNDSFNALWEFDFELLLLIADMNQDGEIIRRVTDDEQIADTTNTKDHPFLFWINDDDDDGEINEGKGAGGDVPKDNNPDHDNDKIDGMRDLVDFFPVFVDIKSTLEAFSADDYKYLLKQEDAALKFMEAQGLLPESDKKRERVDAPLKDVGIAADLAEKEVKLITKEGVELSPGFLSDVKNDEGGIILIEATKKTTKPLTLEIVKKSNNKVTASTELALMIDTVETMFRRVDLKNPAIDRKASSDTSFEATTADPTNNPDDRTKPNYFVWIHGYNVTPESARGWTSEMFKRFHRLGFNGRFIGVNWNGDTGVDYHAGIFNALQSSRALVGELAPAMVESGPITLAGHSAGNMVAASAIAHNGLNVARYYAINSVVPIEAIDSAQTVGRNGNIMQDNMTEVDWKGYPKELYVANWHQLFKGNENDDRKALTWKDYFEEIIEETYNFYSPGEEVVENARNNESVNAGVFSTISNWAEGGSLGEHAWVIQEMGKGCNGLIVWSLFECSGGWGFNTINSDLEFIGQKNPDYDPIFQTEPEFIPYFNAAEATDGWDNGNGELMPDDLAQYGFFRKFSHFDLNESEYSYLYGAISEPKTFISETHQWDLLASAIPSMSFAAAANPLEILPPSRNFNMEAMRGDNQAWPQERQTGFFGSRWLHSDIKNISMPYIFPIYEKMLKEGGFINEN